jgi:hypothetical protein
MPDCEQETVHAIGSIISLLGDEAIQDTLKDQEHYAEALQKLTLPDKAWAPLLQLLTRVEQLQSRAADGDQPASSPKQSGEGVGQAGGEPKINPYAKTQLEAFDQIRAAFWISMSLSVGLFMVGLLLTGFALYETTQQAAVSISALTIGGLGLADFTLLFFRRPWQDISVNLSNAQQVRTITTTYLVGLGLIQRQDSKGLEMLDGLTNRSVKMLEQYTEARDSSSIKSATKAGP